jgi:hypothetical protein
VISTECRTSGWKPGFTGGGTDEREAGIMGGRPLEQEALVALPGPQFHPESVPDFSVGSDRLGPCGLKP